MTRDQFHGQNGPLNRRRRCRRPPPPRCEFRLPEGSVRGERANLKGLVLGCIGAKFARKYAFESSRRDLHNALLCTIL